MSLICFTGGPGGGKSPAVEEIAPLIRLRRRVCMSLREAAGGFFNNGLKHDIIVSKAMKDLLQRNIFSWQYYGENSYMALASAAGELLEELWVVLCDRGLFDGAAYLPDDIFSLYEKAFGLLRCTGLYRYKGIVHVVTAADGAEEHYKTNTPDGKNESPEESRKLDKKTLDAYIGHPRISIVHNLENGMPISFEKKKERILEAVLCMIGDNTERTVRYSLPDFTASALESIESKVVRQDVCSLTLSEGKLIEKVTMHEGNKEVVFHTCNDQIIDSSSYEALFQEKPKSERHMTRYWLAHNYQYFKIDQDDTGSILEMRQRHAQDIPVAAPQIFGRAVRV